MSITLIFCVRTARVLADVVALFQRNHTSYYKLGD